MNAPLVQAVLIFVHLLAAAVWVGGMAAMHHAVRPAAVSLLEPPQRLPFMSAALGRFFGLVSTAIVALLVTGFAMIYHAGGFKAVPVSVHLMLGIGLVMMALYGHIRFAAWPRLQRSVRAREWPVGAIALGSIRRVVGINLMLGVLVFAIATVGPALLPWLP